VAFLLSRPAGTQLQAGRTVTVTRAAILLGQPQRSLNSCWGSPGTGKRSDREPWCRGAPGRLLRRCNSALVITRFMNKPPRPPVWLRRRRAPLIGVLIASGTLVVAACGSSPNNAAVAHLGTTTTTSGHLRRASAAGYYLGPGAGSGPAEARGREAARGRNKVSTFPEATRPTRSRSRVHAFARGAELPRPQRPGVIQVSGIDTGSSTFQAAAKACRHLLPTAVSPRPPSRRRPWRQRSNSRNACARTELAASPTLSPWQAAASVSLSAVVRAATSTLQSPVPAARRRAEHHGRRPLRRSRG